LFVGLQADGDLWIWTREMRAERNKEFSKADGMGKSSTGLIKP
jgi:hypothetical protein